jgi:hypothetical protein
VEARAQTSGTEADPRPSRRRNLDDVYEEELRDGTYTLGLPHWYSSPSFHFWLPGNLLDQQSHHSQNQIRMGCWMSFSTRQNESLKKRMRLWWILFLDDHEIVFFLTMGLFVSENGLEFVYSFSGNRSSDSSW